MITPGFRMSFTVLGSSDPRGLASFYRELLGWETLTEEPGWVLLDPAGHPFCLFAAG